MKKQTTKKPGAKVTFWTPEKIKDLKKYFPTKDNQEIAETLGTTVRAVRSMAFRLGLKKVQRYWTYGQEQFLLKNWEKMTAVKIGEELNKTRWAVINKYRILTGK